MLFFECAMIGWTTMIAYCLYCAVVLQRGSPSRAKMHGIVWTTCLVLSLLPLFTGSYGDSGPWCWIAGHDVAVRRPRRSRSFLPPPPIEKT